MELAQGCAVSAASLAAILDGWSRRIPNWVTFGSLILGLVINSALHGVDGALGALGGAALGMALLLPFYLVRAVGAGDVKLLGGVGAILGPQALISVAVYGAIVGGLMSIAILLQRRRLLSAICDIVLYHRPPRRSGATAPYGVAIASGVYLSLVLPSVLG